MAFSNKWLGKRGLQWISFFWKGGCGFCWCYLPSASEVSVHKVKQASDILNQLTDVCPCVGSCEVLVLRGQAVWQGTVPTALCRKRWMTQVGSCKCCRSEGPHSAQRRDSRQRWAVWGDSGWERRSDAAGNPQKREHEKWHSCLMGPDSFGVCEMSALAQPRSSDGQIQRRQPQERLRSSDWSMEVPGTGSLSACAFLIS